MLEAVTPVTETVCELELHQAEVRVQVVVVEELTVIFQLPKIEFQFMVFMLVQLTRVACFQAIVVSIADILSYTAFFVGACVVSAFQLEA